MTSARRIESSTWPAHAGETAALIRSRDWTATALGAAASWSASLRTALGIMLSARQPAALFWGDRHVFLYNDALAAALGPRMHPRALGLPGREAGLDHWDVIEPHLLETAAGAGALPGTPPLCVAHGTDSQDASWNCSYSPVEDPEAPSGVGGVLLLCVETTAAVEHRRIQERLTAAMHAGRFGIHDYDPRTGVIKWDATAARLWGLPADEIATYEMFAAGLHPEDLPRVEELVAWALDPAGPGRYDAEYRVIDRTDGTLRWVHADGDVVFENGQAVRLLGTVQDVTERKQAEEQLRRSSDTFYRLIHDNPFGIYIVDADFRLREVSRGAEKVFQNVRPLLGRDFAEVLRSIWTEPFASEAIGRFRRTLETGEAYAAASTSERQDIGETEAYDWRIERVALPDGRFGVVCYFYDLSQRRQLEEALRQSADRLQLALDAAGLGTWDLDLGSDTAVRSLRHDQMFGYLEQQREWGQAIAERHVLEEDRPIFREAFRRALTTGVLSFEARVRWPDGSIHWIAPSGRTYYGDDGRPVRMAGVVADLTERKHAEAARQLLVRELNHRVRNLFAVMDAIVYLTAETTMTPGDMASALSGRLLALARAHELILPEAAGETRGGDGGTLGELVTAVVSPHLREDSERIRIDGPPMPLAARAATSMALVLHELATNAAKYGALSVPQGRVEVRWRTDGERMLLSWTERGGPLVAVPPERRGFGSLLARSSIEGQLSGTITYDWAKSGLGITALIPLKRLLP